MYKVLIRPLEIADAEISWRWRNNPKIWEFTGSRPATEITFEIERNWIEKVVNDETSKRFAILVDDIYVGNIQLTSIVKNECAEYHIFIGDTNYWNKGIARLASLQIIRYAKNVLELKKLVLQVNPNHLKAIKIYQSINFIINSDEIKMELELENSPKPLVSIFVMVYNHEKYINQAIDSILMQKSNFDFEIVVGEDYSTDNSREILIEYQNKFPGKFKLLLHNRNIGAHQNQLEVLNNCKGKYVAICEGDDYWTDPLKLQRQVDFLSANQEFGICFHKTEEINLFDKSKNRIFPNINNNTIYTIEDYILNNWTATCSIVFTNKFYKNENWFTTLPFGDLGLVLIIMKNSNKKAMVFNDIMGAYRVHKGGVHGNLQQNSLKIIDAYKQHLVFGKIIKEKLLHESIYSKYFLKKKIQTYEKLYQLYKSEDFYIKGLSNKIVLFFLKMRYKLLYS